MSKSTRVLLGLVLAAAIGLAAALGADYVRDARRLRSLEAQLAESRAAWEATAETKEALQAELSLVRNEIREAELTLEESNTRAEELRRDIEELEQEIAGMK